VEDFNNNITHYLEVELLRKKRETVLRDIMILTSGREETKETFPSIFNAYIETVFMGYPALISHWSMETAEVKVEGAKKLYQDVFKEEANF
jgi:hypothetical protein